MALIAPTSTITPEEMRQCDSSRHILFGVFMAKDSWHGVIFPAYQVVVMPECFTKTIPADGLELTNSTLGARLP